MKKQCKAVLHHGPGHQFRTHCQLTEKHTIHYCRYGCCQEEAYWKGKEKCTGYFDDPPPIPKGIEK